MDKEIILTQGCLKDIMLGTKINSPIVQIWFTKGIYQWQRVHVSDGVFFTQLPSMVGKSVEMSEREQLQPYSVVVLDDYTTQKMHHPKGHWLMLFINKMTVLKKSDTVSRKIGNPIPVTKFQFKGLTSFEKCLLEKSKISPIAALDPSSTHRCIQARIVSKEDVQKSNEDFFNVELADSSGSISATAYNDACHKFHTLIEVNKVYVIWRFQLLRDETTPNKMRLILKRDSEVELAVENVQFNFATTTSFNDAPLNTTVDIIGVCMYTSAVINSEDESRRGPLRYMNLSNLSADTNGKRWQVMLWDDAAEKLDISSTAVVAIKGAEIVEKSGCRYISVDRIAQVFVNPNIEEAREIERLHEIKGERIKASMQSKVDFKIA